MTQESDLVAAAVTMPGPTSYMTTTKFKYLLPSSADQSYIDCEATNSITGCNVLKSNQYFVSLFENIDLI